MYVVVHGVKCLCPWVGICVTTALLTCLGMIKPVGGCARPLGHAWLLNGLCAHCTIHPPLLPLSSACLYEHPLSHMIGACKYHGQLAYGVFFAELLMYAHLSRSRLGGGSFNSSAYASPSYTSSWI